MRCFEEDKRETHILKTCELLQAAWMEHPDLTISELLLKGAVFPGAPYVDFEFTDEEFLRNFKRWLGGKA